MAVGKRRKITVDNKFPLFQFGFSACKSPAPSPALQGAKGMSAVIARCTLRYLAQNIPRLVKSQKRLNTPGQRSGAIPHIHFTARTARQELNSIQNRFIASAVWCTLSQPFLPLYNHSLFARFSISVDACNKEQDDVYQLCTRILFWLIAKFYSFLRFRFAD